MQYCLLLWADITAQWANTPHPVGDNPLMIRHVRLSESTWWIFSSPQLPQHQMRPPSLHSGRSDPTRTILCPLQMQQTPLSYSQLCTHNGCDFHEPSTTFRLCATAPIEPWASTLQAPSGNETLSKVPNNSPRIKITFGLEGPRA